MLYNISTLTLTNKPHCSAQYKQAIECTNFNVFLCLLTVQIDSGTVNIV